MNVNRLGVRVSASWMGDGDRAPSLHLSFGGERARVVSWYSAEHYDAVEKGWSASAVRGGKRGLALPSGLGVAQCRLSQKRREVHGT